MENKSPSRELLSPVWRLLNPFEGLLTLFDDTLKQVLGLPNAKFESITQDELHDKFLSLAEVCITYNNKVKIVQNIVISTPISIWAVQTHLSVSASTIRGMTLHSGLSTFLIWTATFPPIQLTVFIYLNW